MPCPAPVMIATLSLSRIVAVPPSAPAGCPLNGTAKHKARQRAATTERCASLSSRPYGRSLELPTVGWLALILLEHVALVLSVLLPLQAPQHEHGDRDSEPQVHGRVRVEV